jgi:hypothetical protein
MAKWGELIVRTITSQYAVGLPGGMRPPRADGTLQEFERCAMAGSLACCYQAGIKLKNRLLGPCKVTARNMVGNNGPDAESVQVTNQRAFTYMLRGEHLRGAWGLPCTP